MRSPLMAVQLLRGAGKGMAIIDAFACLVRGADVRQTQSTIAELRRVGKAEIKWTLMFLAVRDAHSKHAC